MERMTLAGRTVLVTGASGTVGSAVLRRLGAGGACVRAMMRRAVPTAGAEVVEGDLTDRASLERAVDGAEVVLHCAAEVSLDPAACQAVNVDGMRNLLGVLGARMLVHVSTASVYDWRRGLSFDEESALWSEPLEPYGYTKAEGERLVRASGAAAAILRPVMVLSMHPRSYWGPQAKARAAEQPEPVMPLGAVPYVDVDNLAMAIERAAVDEVARGRAYDVIDGYGDAGEYMAAVYGAIGRPAPAVPEGAPRMTVAGERIRRELGYAPVDRWRAFLRALGAS